MIGRGRSRGTSGARRSIAGLILGVIAAGAWVAAPAVAAPGSEPVSLERSVMTDASESSAAVVPIRATRFGMFWMGEVTQVARIDFVGDPRAVIYPGYYPDGAVVGEDKTPQAEVDLDPTGNGVIWFSYDAPSGYQAFTQVIDGVASGSFGLYMVNGEELLDNFTASVAGLESEAGGLSTVSLQGDWPYWYGNRVEVVADGEVLASMDSNTGVTWSLDVPNVPAGEHTWEVRLVSEGEIIMVREISVITTSLDTPLVHPAALTTAGVVAFVGLVFVRRRRSVQVA